MEMKKLTVHCYAENLEDERRVTLSPMNINVVAAEIDDVKVNNRSLRHVTILLSDGGSIDLLLNHADLDLLESVVGAFCFD